MLYVDRTQADTRVLHVPSPSRKMARRLARLEATSLERVRNWVTTHSLLQAVLLWLSFAMAIIWKGQNGGPIATVNGWFLGMAAGSVVTVATAGAVVIIIFLAAIVIDIALSGDGNEEADRPLGYKAFINSCQPLAVWCVAATSVIQPKVHLRYMATGVLAQGAD